MRRPLSALWVLFAGFSAFPSGLAAQQAVTLIGEDMRLLLEVRQELTDPLETDDGRILDVVKIFRSGVIQIEGYFELFGTCQQNRNYSLGKFSATAFMELNQLLGRVQIGFLTGNCYIFGPGEDAYTETIRWVGRDGVRENVVMMGYNFHSECSQDVYDLRAALKAFRTTLTSEPSTISVEGSSAPAECRNPTTGALLD